MVHFQESHCHGMQKTKETFRGDTRKTLIEYG